MKRTGLGVKVENDVLSVLMCEDDMVILSENHNDLQQEMLNAVIKYGRNFNISFSKKSQVLVVNGGD